MRLLGNLIWFGLALLPFGDRIVALDAGAAGPYALRT